MSQSTILGSGYDIQKPLFSAQRPLETAPLDFAWAKQSAPLWSLVAAIPSSRNAGTTALFWKFDHRSMTATGSVFVYLSFCSPNLMKRPEIGFSSCWGRHDATHTWQRQIQLCLCVLLILCSCFCRTQFNSCPCAACRSIRGWLVCARDTLRCTSLLTSCAALRCRAR